jgi:DnaA-homolog protein
MTVNSSPQIPFQFGDFQKNDLDSFITGDNQELVALIKLITNKEKNHRLYIWGESGTGKSHLLQAACKAATDNNLQVAYIPLKQISELSAEMLHDLGELDLVCVDDLESVIGQIEWQQGLTWLYNELRDNNHSMIISGNKTPTTIELEVEDLKSRLGWDQVVQIQSPSDELKIEILKQKANARSFELSDEVIEFLIRRVDRSLSSLIEILDKIDHASLAEKRKITIPFVKELIN